MLRLTGDAQKIAQEDVQALAKRATGHGFNSNRKTLSLYAKVQGNYTVAIIFSSSYPAYVGVSKRNPIDKFSESVGLKIAIRRCFNQYNANPPR